MLTNDFPREKTNQNVDFVFDKGNCGTKQLAITKDFVVRDFKPILFFWFVFQKHPVDHLVWKLSDFVRRDFFQTWP